MHDKVGDELAGAVMQLEATLSELAAMAGTDPGGTSWAAAYDHTAEAALHAVLSLMALSRLGQRSRHE